MSELIGEIGSLRPSCCNDERPNVTAGRRLDVAA